MEADSVSIEQEDSKTFTFSGTVKLEKDGKPIYFDSKEDSKIKCFFQKYAYDYYFCLNIQPIVQKNVAVSYLIKSEKGKEETGEKILENSTSCNSYSFKCPFYNVEQIEFNLTYKIYEQVYGVQLQLEDLKTKYGFTKEDLAFPKESSKEKPENERCTWKIENINHDFKVLFSPKMKISGSQYQYSQIDFCFGFIDVEKKLYFVFRAKKGENKDYNSDYSFCFSISGFEEFTKNKVFYTKDKRKCRYFKLDFSLDDLKEAIKTKGVIVKVSQIKTYQKGTTVWSSHKTQTSATEEEKKSFKSNFQPRPAPSTTNDIKEEDVSSVPQTPTATKEEKEKAEDFKAKEIREPSRSYSHPPKKNIPIPYVGLKNQGATCYMNSALQSLFHVCAFRKLVFNIPTTGEEIESKSIILSLQRLFAMMQLQDKPVSTKGLTDSFGWSSSDVYTQHDIEEFLHILLDNLETKLKKCNMDSEIRSLYVGKTRLFVKGINKEFSNEKIDEFYDLVMNVKDCDSLERSFEQYTSLDKLTGQNQYQTEEFGLQDALMGTDFMSLPNVLQIHLRRFQYDPIYGRMIKIHDRFTFPKELNLKKYLSDKAEDNSDQTYVLTSVLVHSGAGTGGGHYFAFIKPGLNSEWFKFNDSTVTVASDYEAIDSNFGGYANTGQLRTFSAYMLIYIKKDKYSEIMSNVTDDMIPSHLKKFVEDVKSNKFVENTTFSRTAVTNVAFCEKEKTIKIVTEEMIKNLELSTMPEEIQMKITVKSPKNGSDLYDAISKQLGIPRTSFRLFKYNFKAPYEFIGFNSTPLSYTNDMTVLIVKTKQDEEVNVSETRSMQIIKTFNRELQKIEFHSIQYPPKNGKAGCLIPYVYSFEDMLYHSDLIIAVQICNNKLNEFKFYDDKIFDKSGNIIIYDKADDEKDVDGEKSLLKYLNTFFNKTEVELIDIKNQSEHINKVNVSNNIKIKDLKQKIAKVNNIEYNPKEMAIQLFEPLGKESYNSKPIYDRYGYSETNLTTLKEKNGLETPRIFYQILDVSEEKLKDLAEIKLIFTNKETKEEFNQLIQVFKTDTYQEVIDIAVKNGFKPTQLLRIAVIIEDTYRKSFLFANHNEYISNNYKQYTRLTVNLFNVTSDNNDNNWALFLEGKQEDEKFIELKEPKIVHYTNEMKTPEFLESLKPMGINPDAGYIIIPSTPYGNKEPTNKSIIADIVPKGGDKIIKFIHGTPHKRASVVPRAHSDSLKIFN